MGNVFDIAKFILNSRARAGESFMTTWKLQKLVYYSQAWATVWDDEPLFDENIEAWANGPVCRELYEAHRGKFKISSKDIVGDTASIKRKHKETIKKVLKFYGDRSAHYLSELTHRETPWKESRKGLPPGERGSRVITLDSLAEYYGGL